MGFEAPSLFVAVRTAHQATNTAIYTIPDDDSAVEGWASAAAFVTPFLQGWLDLAALSAHYPRSA